MTETTAFGERIDGGKTVVEAGAITCVLRFRLTEEGRTLRVERSGFRENPPSLLHGLPYRRVDDLVYNTDVVIYQRE